MFARALHVTFIYIALLYNRLFNSKQLYMKKNKKSVSLLIRITVQLQLKMQLYNVVFYAILTLTD